MSAGDFDREILRVLYPSRFAWAKVQAETKQDSQCIPLGPIHRLGDDEPRDSGVVLAAAAEEDEDEDDGKDKATVDALKKLGKMETKSAREASSGARRQQLEQLIKRTRAKVLVTDEIAERDRAATTETRTGVLHQTSEVSWNKQQARAIEFLGNASPMVFACMKTLENQVMRDGIKFMRGNVELVPSAAFAEYTETRLKPFAYQCVEALLQIGVIPLVYELDPVTGWLCPYVPQLGTYVIYVQRVRGASRYRFFWTDENLYAEMWQRQQVRTRDSNGFQWVGRFACDAYNPVRNDAAGGIEDQTVEILHNMGYDLASDGTIKSRCAAALQCVIESMMAQKRRATAESLSSAPPIATEYDHEAERQDAANFTTGYFTSALNAPIGSDPAGDAASSIELQNRTFKRDQLGMQGLANALRAYEETMGRDASSEFGIPSEYYRADIGGTAVSQPGLRNADGLPAQWRDQYHVSSARKLVALPQARMSADFLPYMDHLDDKICAIFGVPRTYILGLSVRAGTELVADRLSDEVAALRRAISEVLTRVYNAVFMAADASELINVVNRRVSTANLERLSVGPLSLITEADLYVSEAIRRVKLTFPERPAETIESLIAAYGFGAIDTEKFRSQLLRMHGLDPTQACCIQEDLPIEARRFLVPQLADYYKTKMQSEQAQAQQKLAETAQRDSTKLANKQIDVSVEQQKRKEQEGASEAPKKKKKSGGGGEEAKKKE